jgi:hypothetical protein
MSQPEGAHVEIVEDEHTPGEGVIVTRVVVNGVDVGRLAEPPKVRTGDAKGIMATVTLTLVPSRLEIRGDDVPAEGKGFGFTASDQASDLQ